MRFVALMPKRTSIPEMLIYPTNTRPYTPAETGVVKAVNRFVADHGLYLSTQQEKWAFQKP